jgi:hypothetical protein
MTKAFLIWTIDISMQTNGSCQYGSMNKPITFKL